MLLVFSANNRVNNIGFVFVYYIVIYYVYNRWKYKIIMNILIWYYSKLIYVLF